MNDRSPMPPTVADYQAAASLLASVATRTPLVPMRTNSANQTSIYLKLETFQPIGSFKIRGIYHAVAKLTDAQRAKGLSTVSAGNTAQALAWCGRHFRVPSRSIMPNSAPQTKIDAVRALGGEPVLLPTDEVFRYLREHLWEDEPYAFIHPWTDQDVHLGHGSMGLEIIEQMPDVESVFIPVGGGGLLAGVAGALKAAKPSVRIIAVEPDGCPSLHESLRRNEPAHVECNTICDGVAVPYITDEMFPVLRDLVDEAVLVSDESVRAQVRDLALIDKLVAEPSGALAPAAASAIDLAHRGRSVAIVTGGSIDTQTLALIVTE